MSKLGLGIAAGALLMVAGTQISHSADMGVRAAPPPVLATCPGGPFSGFWVGGNLDWAYYKAERNDQDAFLFGTSTSATKSAVAGGVGVGWDWQCRNRVFGVIADWSGTSAKATNQFGPNIPGITDFSVNSKLNSYGTLRTRGGMTIDDILIYLTGGLAYANIKTSWNQVATPALIGIPLDNHFSFNNNPWGFVVGVGAETMLWGRWSLKSEILYMQFQEKTFTGTAPAIGSFSFKNNDSLWVSRLALNYRF